MKRQLSEKELDNFIRHLVCDAGADEQKTNEIADSPALWWGVQRQIADNRSRAPWPPSVFRRWLMIGVPAAALILVAMSLFLIRSDAPIQTSTKAESAPETATDIPLTAPLAVGPSLEVSSHQNGKPAMSRANAVKHRPATERQNRVKIADRQESSSEVRSEFIALSYAEKPESGQMVRVKVPRSMMVTLGLVAAVEQPNSLVDAEVVVGDDGMTHAIRFIR